MPKEARQSAIQRFAQGQLNVLVVTDLLARGMDLDCDAIINLEVPDNAVTYAHRAGRTGRFGRQGAVVTIVCPYETKQFSRLTAGLGVPVTERQLFAGTLLEPSENPKNKAGYNAEKDSDKEATKRPAKQLREAPAAQNDESKASSGANAQSGQGKSPEQRAEHSSVRRVQWGDERLEGRREERPKPERAERRDPSKAAPRNDAREPPRMGPKDPKKSRSTETSGPERTAASKAAQPDNPKRVMSEEEIQEMKRLRAQKRAMPWLWQEQLTPAKKAKLLEKKPEVTQEALERAEAAAQALREMG